MVQEAYVHGVSTRKVDELVKALSMTGISKSRVSELCEELDEEFSLRVARRHLSEEEGSSGWAGSLHGCRDRRWGERRYRREGGVGAGCGPQ